MLSLASPSFWGCLWALASGCIPRPSALRPRGHMASSSVCVKSASASLLGGFL